MCEMSYITRCLSGEPGFRESLGRAALGAFSGGIVGAVGGTISAYTPFLFGGTDIPNSLIILSGTVSCVAFGILASFEASHTNDSLTWILTAGNFLTSSYISRNVYKISHVEIGFPAVFAIHLCSLFAGTVAIGVTCGLLYLPITVYDRYLVIRNERAVLLLENALAEL